MRVSYYPGCSLEGTAKAYNRSSLTVCDCLGVETEEVPAWTCCGSSPALKMDGLLSASLSAHVLSQAETQGVDDVVIPCPFCFRRLISAQEDMAGDPELRGQVEKVTGGRLGGKMRLHSLLGFIRNEIGVEGLKAHVKKPLKGLRVLPYYGCYLVKPHGVTHFDDPENPTSMDDILAALGADVMDWDFKTECCGAGLSLSKTETVARLSGRLVNEAKWRGADAAVVACQLCQSNLDMRQEGGKRQLPVIYFTQLMGLSFGVPPAELGLKQHLVNPMSMLNERGVI